MPLVLPCPLWYHAPSVAIPPYVAMPLVWSCPCSAPLSGLTVLLMSPLIGARTDGTMMRKIGNRSDINRAVTVTATGAVTVTVTVPVAVTLTLNLTSMTFTRTPTPK